MTQAITPNAQSSSAHAISDGYEPEKDFSFGSDCEVETTTWSRGRVIHSISGSSKIHIIVEAHGRFGCPIYKLKEKGSLKAQAYAPSYVRQFLNSWRLDIYDGKGQLLAKLLPKAGAFGLARSLDVTDPEGKILAHSNLFSKKAPNYIKFMSPDQTEEIFSLTADRTQKKPKWNLHIPAQSSLDSRILQIVTAVISQHCAFKFDENAPQKLFHSRIIKPIGKYAASGLIAIFVLFKVFAG